MEDGASAAEGVEEAAFRSGTGGEVDEDLGEFGGKHTNESVAGGASLVAAGVGSDILGADADGGDFSEGENLDVVGFFAELVVV